MISSPQPAYPSAKKAGISDTSVISYGTINIDTRVKVYSKKAKKDTLINSVVITSKILYMPSPLATALEYTMTKPIAIVIPTTTEDGESISKANAIKLYEATGRHLGAFTSVKAAEKYVKKLNVYIALHVLMFANASDDTWLPVSLMKEYEEEYIAGAPFSGIVRLADINDDFAQLTFMNNIINISVEWSMDLNSQVTIELLDPGYRMTEMNYFVPRRDIWYRGARYEIADVSVGPGDGGSPRVTLAICNKSIQRMKRDKRSGSVSASSAYEYAGRAASKFNLGFVGQKTQKTKNTFSTKTDNSEESVWDVLTRTAQENQFVVFESDGRLVYAQQEWLLWKFGLLSSKVYNRKTKKFETKKYVPLLHLPAVGSGLDILGAEMELADLINQGFLALSPGAEKVTGKAFQLATYPSFETSDNDPLAASGSCEVLMPNGGQLRPGFTAMVGPEPNYFFGGYLITNVSFSEGSPDSAKVQFRTPEEPKNQQGKPITALYGTSPTRNLFASSANNLGSPI
jgi:hypothetical protein